MAYAQPFKPIREALPLAYFPQEHRFHIWELITKRKPPPKWLVNEDLNITLPSRAWYEWHYWRRIDPDKKRPPLPYKMREAVILRDGLICHLCRGGVEASDVHIDHVIPVSKGGEDTMDNLHVSHSQCNLRRGNRDLVEVL